MYSRADIRSLVGPGAFDRGESYADAGHVLSADRIGAGRNAEIHGIVRGSGRAPYAVSVLLDASGRPLVGRCTCPVGVDCKHVAATLLVLLGREEADATHAAPSGTAGVSGTARGDAAASGSGQGAPGERAEWERALADLVDVPAPEVAPAPAAWGARRPEVEELALQLRVVEPEPPRWGRPAVPAHERPLRRLGLRPLLRGRSGRWVRTGATWRDLRYGHRVWPAGHVEVLRALEGLARAGQRSSFAYDTPDEVFADEMPGGGFWALLDDAVRAGLPLVGADKAQTPVRVGTASTVLRVSDDGAGGLVVDVAVALDGPGPGRAAPGRAGAAGGRLDQAAADETAGVTGPLDPVGPAAAGVIGEDARGAPVLARLTTPLDRAATALVRRTDPLRVPAADRDRFLAGVLPVLERRFDEVHVHDVERPAAPHPVLVLTVTRRADHVVHLDWSWRYEVGQGDAARVVDVAPALRDETAQAAVLARLGPALGRPVEATVLRGLATADFFATELPALAGLAEAESAAAGLGEVGGGFVVEVVDAPDADAEVRYRVADDVEVEVSLVAPTGGRDWFDLGVMIRAGDRQIPYEHVFRALAQGRDRVLLPDGLSFSLEDERFDRLRELLAETADLQDSMGGPLRVTPYQLDLFWQLEAAGLVDAQAAAWRSALGALADGGTPVALPAPAGLAATLRPYQQAGFEWLAFLRAHGLGGVLADDMGLGKTVQTLAAVVHAHESAVASTGAPPAPVLVVAPTSVVDNWAAEAARFAPGLRVAAVRATHARRGTGLADAVAGADVVITSYALFRLEAEEYQTLDWSMLVLDEAQFVKNRQSVGYRVARELDAPTKIALTGTPLENTLMELWSILSIVSPGLFPDPYAFGQHFAGPIEREGDEGRLAVLRRRIAPFVLRRTKESVAKDLPPRVEHVTEVTLQPRHRRAYDRYLQRERKHVLGLVDDLDKNRFTVFRSLTLLRQAALDVSLVDEAPPGAESIPSSKLDVLFEMLDDVLAEGHTVLIFSQFTRYLGKVRDRLRAAGVEHAYLDGRTRKRAEQIELFTSGQVPVFLVSLKAGGFGLNLTAADYCILLDPWWNPAAEAQAVDRAHRIGQERTVMVYRLVAAGTIEDKVMKLKAAKSQLFGAVLDGGGAGGGGLTADDVRELLE